MWVPVGVVRLMARASSEDRRREELAFGRRIDWDKEGLLGTVFFGPEEKRKFPPLPVGTARTLLENGYIDPKNRHHEHTPTAKTLLDWASGIQTEYRSYQFEIGLIGYMVGPNREDTRITFEGVSIRSPGAIPNELKREAAKCFSPDLLVVDDFDIRVQWD